MHIRSSSRSGTGEMVRWVTKMRRVMEGVCRNDTKISLSLLSLRDRTEKKKAKERLVVAEVRHSIHVLY